MNTTSRPEWNSEAYWARRQARIAAVRSQIPVAEEVAEGIVDAIEDADRASGAA